MASAAMLAHFKEVPPDDHAHRVVPPLWDVPAFDLLD
jgi:hypothetical protein